MDQKVAIVIFIIVVIIALIVITYEIENHYLLEATGSCSLVTNHSTNSTIICYVGERFEGFKLLKVNSNSTQILIYNTCHGPEPTQCIKIINVNIDQSFGGACNNIQNSTLLLTNTISESAVYYINKSAQICF